VLVLKLQIVAPALGDPFGFCWASSAPERRRILTSLVLLSLFACVLVLVLVLVRTLLFVLVLVLVVCVNQAAPKDRPVPATSSTSGWASAARDALSSGVLFGQSCRYARFVIVPITVLVLCAFGRLLAFVLVCLRPGGHDRGIVGSA
jgi:hypothetical protein